MAARRKIESTLPAAAPEPISVVGAVEGLSATASPARDLQNRVSDALNSRHRWSPRRTFLFVLATCGGAWAIAVWALYRVLG
jgi:hypothetical protein